MKGKILHAELEAREYRATNMWDMLRPEEEGKREVMEKGQVMYEANDTRVGEKS